MSSMDLLDVLHTYFRGEKQLGFVIALFGLTALVMGGHIGRTASGGFQWGLCLPLVVLGLGLTGGGGYLAARTGPQVAALDAAYSAAPEAMVAAETARMAKVNANWPRVKLAWTIVLAVGLALVWSDRAGWLTGLSTALIPVAAFLLYCDVSAERRARVYTAALEARAAPERGRAGP